MATLNSAIIFARTQAQTDSNGLTDVNALVFANEALLDFRRQLITHGIDASQIQECYRDATAGTGTYLYPTDMFFLKAIELNYTDTNQANYVVANQMDVSNIPGGNSFSYLRSGANKANPQFDDRGDWYEIFPTPQSTDSIAQLIRLFYFLQPTEYVATTDTISYPEKLDYRVIGWRIAANFLYSQGTARIPDGDKFNVMYQNRINQMIETLSRGVQTPIQATAIQISGWQF